MLIAAGALALFAVAGTHSGARSCAGCHPRQHASQSATGHALALRRALEHPLARAFTPAQVQSRAGRFRFQFSRSDGSLRVRVSDGAQAVEEPIEWAFGAGEQAVTFVSRISPEFYLEHYFSYYSALGTLAPTPGQEGLRPRNLAEAPGLLYKALDRDSGILGCFECHSTGPVATTPRIDPSEPGVRCEACHGPGAAHVATRAKSDIGNPKRLPAVELNAFCGRCHRPPSSDPSRIDWNYAWNVRHQPVYFSQSACFQASGGAFSCLTCHDSHAPLATGAARYDAACATCHKPDRRPPAAECRTGCVDCHMPRVAPQPPLRFTNHWIGVYGDGAKLRPRR